MACIIINFEGIAQQIGFRLLFSMNNDDFLFVQQTLNELIFFGTRPNTCFDKRFSKVRDEIVQMIKGMLCATGNCLSLSPSSLWWSWSSSQYLFIMFIVVIVIIIILTHRATSLTVANNCPIRDNFQLKWVKQCVVKWGGGAESKMEGTQTKMGGTWGNFKNLQKMTLDLAAVLKIFGAKLWKQTKECILQKHQQLLQQESCYFLVV